jgi:N-acylneuraminate cytidylyltransferase/CMP-N,N'-diacetyllegionaminic acid synthase
VSISHRDENNIWPNKIVLGIIPARGGSKAIRGKNIAIVAGKPLIAYTIQAALDANHIDRVIVSTDSQEIAEVACAYGAEVPFLRPPELAQDDTPGIEPVLHAVQWLDEHEGYRPDYVILLQPTSPLRSVHDIEAAIDLALTNNADSVISVCEVKHHPYWAMRLNEDGRLVSFLGMNLDNLLQKYPRRQDLPLVYAENGSIYLAKRSVLLEHKSFYGKRVYGYVMPDERSLDIDSLWDLQLAELILKEKMRHERD